MAYPRIFRAEARLAPFVRRPRSLPRRATAARTHHSPLAYALPTDSVSLDAAPLFSAPPALSAFIDGALQSGWVVKGSRPVTSADSLGAFVGTECAYALASAPSTVVFTAAAYTYASAAAASSASLVRFTYSFPLGAARTNHSAPSPSTYSTIANFPAFAGPATPLPKVLTWRDAFFGPSNEVSDSLGQIASAMIFFGADVAGRAVTLAPLDNFLNHALGDDLGDGTACSGNDAGCWVAGASATVTSLPPGFTHSTLLVADTGITRTFDSWGRVMRAFYGTTKIADVSLTTLGYQTDNGAQLCFGCPGQVLDTCLLNEKAYLDSLKVPIQYLSFQNAWWESGGESVRSRARPCARQTAHFFAQVWLRTLTHPNADPTLSLSHPR